MSHSFSLRVYYEDTDLAGIVYYANYLKFIERARSEWIRGIGVDQAAMKAEQGIVFAVRRVEADYLTPARFDDTLHVTTEVIRVTAARVELQQDVWRNTTLCFSARVTVVAIGAAGQPARIPAIIRHNP